MTKASIHFGGLMQNKEGFIIYVGGGYDDFEDVHYFFSRRF